MASSTIKTACLLLAIAVGGIVTLAPVPAAAARAARGGASASVQLARRHFLDGKRAFERKSYAAALKEFEAGYALEPRPGFLLNMGHAARRMGDLRRAHKLYVKFLATAPPPGERRAAARAVAEIERELPSEAPVSLSPPPAAPPAEAVSPAPAATVAVVAAESSPVAAAREPPAPEPAPAPAAAARPAPEPEAEAEAAPARRAVSPAASRRRLDLAPSRAAVDAAPTLAAHPRASDDDAPPIYRRWWFWAGAGGVVAGVATAILIGSLSSGSSARDRGTWGQLKL